MILFGPTMVNLWGVRQIFNSGLPMRLEISFFRSTIARRMFIMFIACALVPIMLLALVAFTHYPVQFKSRALELLQRFAKTQGDHKVRGFSSHSLQFKDFIDFVGNTPSIRLDQRPRNLEDSPRFVATR